MSLTKELHRAQAQALRDIAEQQPYALPDDIQLPQYSMDNIYPGAYGKLALNLHREFFERAVSTGNQRLMEFAVFRNVRLGFHTLCATLRFAPEAYKRYTRYNGSEGSVHELGEILRTSGEIVNYFAGTENDIAKFRESAFGLDGTLPVCGSESFVISDHFDSPKYILSPTAVNKIETALAHTVASGKITVAGANYRKCPAVGRVLNSLWEIAVDRCVAEPQLFQRDLEDTV